MKKTLYSREHKHLVKKLKEARIQSGLDQVKVAKMLGSAQSHISKVEAGQRKIDIVQLKEFAKIYKKDISYFLK